MDLDENRCYNCLTKYPLINRLAAFTDDELESIAEALERTFGEHPGSPTLPLVVEIDVELERRKA